MSKKKKQKFEVGENESIDQCLQRMEQEGYMPTRRMEEPVFQEVMTNGKQEFVPIRQKIVFEGVLK
ncbi:NETI motif-containing protein [Bacillus sp. FJAT-45350]|uniref:NETI motif-containing protein n=1 Tax=Bacillus sp. FJAT-45350 TaxID=2011014 RepID=UPI000BB92CF4|nr:NETI motif-containing protein [Bacillus sp. FJAT-45350]